MQGMTRIVVAAVLAGTMLVAGAAAGDRGGPARADLGSARAWRALASRGLAYLQEGRRTADPAWFPRAERALRRSLALREEGNVEAMLGMGVVALGRHDFADALAWGRRATAISPYAADARGIVGDALLELGRYRAAARAFQAMIDLRPGLSSYARVSYFRELIGDVPGAIQAMRRAVGFAATSEDAAWAGAHLGDLYFGSGRLALASRAYRVGRVSDPGAILPRVGLARVAAARGDLDRAVEILSNASRRYPAPEVLILLAEVQTVAGDREGVRDSMGLVRAMDRLARSSGVDTDLEMALFFADHGLEGALERARAAYRRRPGVGAADALAWALSAEGHDLAAARRAREAMRLGTRSAMFHFHAGMIALRLDRTERARRLLRETLAINPHFSLLQGERARRILDRLDARR